MELRELNGRIIKNLVEYQPIWTLFWPHFGHYSLANLVKPRFFFLPFQTGSIYVLF